MVKQLLLTCLIAGAAFVTFGAAHLITDMSGSYFIFDQAETVYVLGDTSRLSAFGYYYINNPTVLIAGDYASGTIGSFQAGDAIGIWMTNKPDATNGREIVYTYTTSNTGIAGTITDNSILTLAPDVYLATIDIWEWNDNSGGKSGKPPTVMSQKSFQFGISRKEMWTEEEGYFASLDDDELITGQPLPDVMKALAIIGCAFIGKRLRNKMKK